MKKMITFFMCVMLFLCPLSVKAETSLKVLELPGDDGSGYPIIGINSGYNENPDVHEVVVPENIVLLGERIFLNNTNLSKIELHSKIQKIGENAFKGTAFYENSNNWDEQGVLYIGDALIEANPEKIGDSYEIRPGTRIIADGAAQGCWKMTEVITPDSLVHIGMNAFSYCEKLERVSLGERAETLGRGPFYQCDLKEIVVDEGNVHFEVSEEGVLMDEELTHILKCPQQLGGTLKLPSQVTNINAYAFEGCKNIDGITLPEECIFIGEYAFSNCNELTTVVFTEKLEYIDSYAFAGCDFLEIIEIPDNVTYLGESAFENCTNLKYAVLGDGIEELQDEIFEKCYNLDHVEFGRFVSRISATAFYDTKYLYNIDNYEDGLLIDYYGGCLIRVAPWVKICEIPDSVQVIADGAFDDTNVHGELKKIYIPKDIFRFNWAAFGNVSDDVKLYYDGSTEEFAEIAGADGENLNLITKDLRQMGWRVAVVGVLCFAAVTLIVSSDRENGEEQEEDYNEE